MAHPVAVVIVSMALAGFIMLALQATRLFQEAEKMGLPVLFTPIDILNPIYAMAPDRITAFFDSWPLGLGQWVHWSNFSCFFANRYKLHEQYGPVFVVVTPFTIVIHVAEGAAADEILSRRKDFIKPPAMYKPLEIFGPNVDTLNGEGWQRHRRLTTPPFNENNSKHVWIESLRQTRDMLKVWMKVGKDGVVRSNNDTMTLALHVLTSAGFGKSYDFEGGVTKLSDGHTMTYREALKTILNHVFFTIIITSVKLPVALLPKKLQEVKIAIDEFKIYMAEMVEEEKSSIDKTDVGKDNLMSVLVRASESENQGRNGLSQEEIFGNLFIYNLAGHDTTANTLAYAVTLMSTDIKWQKWLREELISVFGDKDNIEDWEYEASFPKLKRCLALMQETLRLYGPIVVTPKYVDEHPVTTTIMGESVTIPPGTYVPINVAALNTSPEYWGSDALVWRPDRWILTEKESEEELLFEPPPGAFLPWASGPRVCPGKKFSQVEFVAVVARLFKNNRVKVKLEEGEAEKDGIERAWNCVEDSTLNVTLQMRHPEKVKLVWEEWE